MRSSVELPGPQPRSITLRGDLSGTCASRSRGGRVRSSSNLRYWRALQSSDIRTIFQKSLPSGLTRGWGPVSAENATNRRVLAHRDALAGELLVLDPMRDRGVGSEPAHLVLLVVLVVALEPLDVAIALEGEDVGGDAVEEPAVVADDDGAAGEVFQRFLQCAQRVDVEIV